jgi:hypothetical protein
MSCLCRRPAVVTLFTRAEVVRVRMRSVTTERQRATRARLVGFRLNDIDFDGDVIHDAPYRYCGHDGLQ